MPKRLVVLSLLMCWVIAGVRGQSSFPKSGLKVDLDAQGDTLRIIALRYNDRGALTLPK